MCLSLLDWLRDQETSVSFSSFLVKLLFDMGSFETNELPNLVPQLVKLLFYMNSFESMEWPNLVPQLHTGDSVAIVLLRGGSCGRL